MIHQGHIAFQDYLQGKGYTDLMPVEYIDADYGRDLDMHCFCVGQVFVQAGGPTSWGAQLLLIIALSITKAEYMAVSQGMKQIKWMFSGMDEVGYPQAKPAVLYNNNARAISLTKNTKNNSWVKHINIHHHFVHKCIENGDIIVCHIPSSENLTDIFTKPLGYVAHHQGCVMLCLCEDTKQGEVTEHIKPGGVL